MTVVPNGPKRRGRFRPLLLLEAWLEAPMFLLALAWLWLFIVEVTQGLTPYQQRWATTIWALFILEFVVKLAVAPRKLTYLKKNQLTLISLIIPAFRAFRLVRALRLLQTARITSITRFVRALTSASRLVKDIQEAQGERPAPETHVGVILACSIPANQEELEAFVERLTADVSAEIEKASGMPWVFHQPEPVRLENDGPHQPSDFLDDASRHMAEGPYDLVLIVTDVALMSRRKRLEAGLASRVSRIICLSTRKLASTVRRQPARSLTSEPVRRNAAGLLLHLLGHVMGLGHKPKSGSNVMAPFIFRQTRQSIPRFTVEETALLKKRAARLPERELRGGGILASLLFHILMMARHPGDVIFPLLKSDVILLSLSLPSLATAAVAPALLLVFTAEIWDVGLNMDNRTAIIFAVASIVGASFYLLKVQSLFLPRKDKRVVTEHLAVANGVIFLSILLACIGLFVLVCVLMLLVELYIFPEGLMQTWPTLDDPVVTLADQLRLAAFISTIGVTTGALAGGFENRTLIQHLALFHDEP